MELGSIGSPTLWIAFLGFVVVVLAIDLGVVHRKAHTVGVREALVTSLVWIALALAFNAWVWHAFGRERGMEFLTGYLVEKALSVDNIFVFVVLFSALGVPSAYQHRVLFWGILSALLLRAPMIFAGSALLTRFHWLVYVFGAFLVVTGVKLFLHRNDTPHPESGAVMRLARRLIPSTSRYDGSRFFTIEDGRRVATPLLMALVLVELTDVVFALDSIPAIFAITRDPFIVFTSNIFAILGLRSLFFLLAGLVQRFRYLKVGLSAVLVFAGAKMAAVDVVRIPPAISVTVIGALLVVSVLASLWVTRTGAGAPRGSASAPAPLRGGAARAEA